MSARKWGSSRPDLRPSPEAYPASGRPRVGPRAENQRLSEIPEETRVSGQMIIRMISVLTATNPRNFRNLALLIAYDILHYRGNIIADH
jgi:hypothetical protein